MSRSRSNSKGINGKKDQPKLSFSGGGQKGQKLTSSQPIQLDTSNYSNSSMTSIDDPGLSNIQTQLEGLNSSMKSLRGDLKTMLRKDEIETLIKTTLTDIMSTLEEKLKVYIQSEISNKMKYLTDRIDGLEFENKELKEKIVTVETSALLKIKNLEENVTNNYNVSRDANKRANNNEQYSRKNNVKIMDIPESRGETEQQLTNSVADILKKQGVTLEQQDIIAIHRLPSKKHSVKPVIIKLKNNNIKATIMRKRKEMRQAGHKLVDDVTILNQGLISRLLLHPNIKSAWYFNGSVYGLSDHDERIRFDIYDNIDTIICNFRERRRSQH